MGIEDANVRSIVSAHWEKSEEENVKAGACRNEDNVVETSGFHGQEVFSAVLTG